MSILNIRPVVRGGSKALIGIAGVSGSGKTYTALLMARGMVSKASEIGFLDTENGRGSFYADILDEPFMIADLVAPFSPKRYSDAIKEFQEAGVKVLVIDSVSHESEGEGGMSDIADAPLLLGKKMANWIGAKKQHKSFMNTLLQCNMHIICCIRAREKTDFKDPSKPISLGIQPVCEKNFMFEMTASILMENEGRTHQPLKIPAFLKSTFGNGQGYLGIETGKKIIDWIENGEKEDPEITRLRSELMMVCENGLEALKSEWKKLTPALMKKMKPYWPVYEASANGYDEMNKSSEGEILLDELKELFELKKDNLSEEEIIHIERIFEKKETNSYQKVQTVLKNK
jgi:hypothetical protein